MQLQLLNRLQRLLTKRRLRKLMKRMMPCKLLAVAGQQCALRQSAFWCQPYNML